MPNNYPEAPSAAASKNSIRSRHPSLSRRGAGILLPISALPSAYGIGNLGKEARKFIDFLEKAGQTYWQVLPVGPTSYGDSPYQSFSAFAGNPYFIDPETFMEEGILTKDELESISWQERGDRIEYSTLYENRFSLLKKAFSRSSHKETREYISFCLKNSFWLEDYAVFMACKTHFGGVSWQEWPKELRLFQKEAVLQYSTLLEEEVEFWKFCQFSFFRQWKELREYANSKGVLIIGDMPIYVAMDSADVWSHSRYFQLDEEHRPKKVAGVPPDAFSEDGQLWGNPLYDWEQMEKDDFHWWRERMKAASRLFDCVRIDHFIGICRYFSVPAEDTTSKNGSYYPGPGMKLIKAIQESAEGTEIIAEDLGILVPEVEELLEESGYPGMKVLQFAFDGRKDNDHLPYMYRRNLVAYAGTHDNDTLVGWYESLSEEERKLPSEFLNIVDSEELPVAAMRLLYASPANTVIFQAQDVLGLPGEARMNFPSTMGENWRWRLLPGQLSDSLAGTLKNLAAIFGRERA